MSGESQWVAISALSAEAAANMGVSPNISCTGPARRQPGMWP
jgi:hypothetical protein